MNRHSAGVMMLEKWKKVRNGTMLKEFIIKSMVFGGNQSLI